jgi:hypothetical protein
MQSRKIDNELKVLYFMLESIHCKHCFKDMDI